MSIIDTLITDRSAADLSALRSQLAIPFDQWTAEQKEQFKLAVSKGAYNASDLNRVNEACLYLAGKFREYGYQVDVKLPTITEGKSRLPAGYTEVAYIQSSGTQYVDTGFMPNQDTKVVMDAQSVGVNEADTGQSFFGARTSNTKMFAAYWHRTNAAYYIFYNDGYTTVASDRLTSRMTVTMDKNKLDVGGVVSVSRDYVAFECDYSLFLFASNLSGAADYFGINKLYSCQIYDNGTLVRDYIPCIDPGGEVGLYDIVTGAFYGNAGTGVFTAGDVVDAKIVVRNYWKVGDIPQRHHMEEYLQNINNLRASLELASGTPDTPSDMDNLTFQEANDIELILVDVQTLLSNMAAAWFYSGEIYSGEVI